MEEVLSASAPIKYDKKMVSKDVDKTKIEHIDEGSSVREIQTDPSRNSKLGIVFVVILRIQM